MHRSIVDIGRNGLDCHAIFVHAWIALRFLLVANVIYIIISPGSSTLEQAEPTFGTSLKTRLLDTDNGLGILC